MSNTISRRKMLKHCGYSLAALALPIPILSYSNTKNMISEKKFDVIIIGGSYAGLSAAMALGRALRHVLIIDSGLPCNRQTPYSHNFITHDGEKPSAIAQKAKEQALHYKTIQYYNGLATVGKQIENGFQISTKNGEVFEAKKIIFASGVKDNMPNIKGFDACWGISVIHCPYCHGYEVRHQNTGIFANGDMAYHYAQLISNWTKSLTIFTNGKATFTEAQLNRLQKHQIAIVENEIAEIIHEKGQIQQLLFTDDTTYSLQAIYARPQFEQHCKIAEQLGCELTEQGLLKVDMFQKTTIEGVFACGDNASLMRSVANAVATGNTAGAVLNNLMIEATFNE